MEWFRNYIYIYQFQVSVWLKIINPQNGCGHGQFWSWSHSYWFMELHGCWSSLSRLGCSKRLSPHQACPVVTALKIHRWWWLDDDTAKRYRRYPNTGLSPEVKQIKLFCSECLYMFVLLHQHNLIGSWIKTKRKEFERPQGIANKQDVGFSIWTTASLSILSTSWTEVSMVR